MGHLVQKKQANTKSRQHSGSAMAASGAALTGTGLLAGGIPGAREPAGLEVFNLRGATKKQRRKIEDKQAFEPKDPRGKLSPMHRANRGHNLKILAPQPRAGILGYRASVHDGFIKDKQKLADTGTLAERGRIAGQLEAEHKIVRGMRIARRGFGAVTIGGAALTTAGLHRKKSPGPAKKPVRKRESSRERGTTAGTAGAAGGGVAGAYTGLRAGTNTGLRLTDRKINSEWVKQGNPRPPKGSMVVGGNTFVRRMRGVSMGAKVGVPVGAAAMGATGYRLARGDKVTKRDPDNASHAALAGGLTTAGIGESARLGLNRFGRKYDRSARDHVLRAQKLAPHYGGLHVTPAKVSREFGNVLKPAKVTRKPEIEDWKLAESKAHLKVPVKDRAQVARHRGIAAQERHFADVFESSSRQFARLRAPGLAVAGAGAAGLLASREQRKNQRKGKVRKADYSYGIQERRISPLRATEAAAGITLLGWGGSRLGLVRGTLAAGARRPGNAQIKWKRAEKARQAVESSTGRGAAMLGRSLNTGFKLRPVEGAVGGALLVNHAVPVRRKTFTQIQAAPTQQGGY